ncbi:hypothetical protein SAMN05443572_10482 [Myxococcus fulvus]|uniref:Outer membrane protein beta-barrel domain-containing protein n=1 Tax=Myxococcus fulvus TaxID=33 RepID=A0A511SZG9_MYXFU|nr:hypothetical protein [Myxococcus fulvus]AKF83639.1 hypothetical protein MFUL124B02_36880 [Myxococcus fulvus 124B02]GEN07296.1 hypothetical protein MFU01_23330 [Myxococcus fulvus]SET96145.1 hypothetical protein SAMN05443572_10482 [Myxococcus fulvus]
MTTATPSTRRRAAFLRRHGTALACLTALATGAAAHAQEGEGGGDSPYRFGLLVDAGAPHGIGLSAVLKPVPWLRLQAGPTTNTLSLGLRGGLSILPLQTFIAPSINAEAGYYFGSDYNDVVDWLGAKPSRATSAIQDISYNYVAGSVGLEIGAASRFNFFLHLGLSYVRLGVKDATALIEDATDESDITARNLTVRATIPSVKVGFLFYFF